MAGAGQNVLIQSARPLVVGWLLKRHIPAFLILLVPPTVVALAAGEYILMTALLPGALVSVLVWRIGQLQRTPEEIRGVEGLITTGIAFGLACIVMLPAYMVTGLGLVDGLFESMSAITTTGLSVHPAIETLTFAELFMRHWSQWCCGLAVLVVAIALVGGSSRAVSTRLGAVALDNRNRLASTQSRARRMLLVYAVVTVATWAFLLVVSRDPAEALLITLAAVSTAGFAPASDSLAGYPSLFIAITLTAAFIGSLSFDQLGFLKLRHFPNFWQRLDILPLLAAVLLAATLVSLFEWLSGRVDPISAMGHALAMATSAQTTAGFSTIDVLALTDASILTLIVSMTVGGDVGSTAGGIKIMRMLVLAAVLRAVSLRARAGGSALITARRGTVRLNEGDILAATGLVIIYALTCCVMLIIFLASGYPMLPSLFEIVSALSTVGLSAGVTSPELANHLKWTLIVAMWLGRVEFLALLIILMPATWRS